VPGTIHGPTTGSQFDSKSIGGGSGGGIGSATGIMELGFQADQQQAGWDASVQAPSPEWLAAMGWGAPIGDVGIADLPGPLLNANTVMLLGYAEGTITFGDPLSGNGAFTVGSVPWYDAADDVGGWLWMSQWVSPYDPNLGYGEITATAAQVWNNQGESLPGFSYMSGEWYFPNNTWASQFGWVSPDVFVGISQWENNNTGAYGTEVVISPANGVTVFSSDSGGPVP
jgi:hypothetical protein